MISAKSSTGGRNVGALADRFRRAESTSGTEEARVCAPVLARMLDTYYDARQSPDGKAWAQRISGGSWPLLEKTGRLRASRTIVTGPGFLTIGYEHPAEHLDRGTSTMVARRLLPEGPTLSRPLSLALGATRLEWWRNALGAS